MQREQPIERVDIDIGASSAEVRDVEAAFSRAGFDVTVEADYVRRSTGALPWVVIVVLGMPVRSFLNGFFETPGKRAYAALEALVKDVWRARHSDVRAGAIDLVDPVGTHVILPPQIPDEAIAALGELDWEQLEGGYLTWNDERRQWENALSAARW
jgi:hypothetical protein